MTEISAALVKELRESTGAGMMDCKRALVETAGDIDAARKLLREKGMASAGKRAGRDTTEGKVAVSPTETPSLASPPARARAETPPNPGPTLLIANERAVVATKGPVTPPRVERIAPEAVRTALIWQGPSLVFAATPLAEVAAQFNRRNPIQIVLADPALATLPIGGSFRPEHVEAFVQLLESGNEILVDRSDATRLVLRAAK